MNYLKLAQQRRNEIEHYWPANVFLPLQEWYELILDHHKPEIVTEVSQMSIIAPHRYTRSIYRFDETLLESLLSTHIEGNIPSELLTRLPEWCVYIDIDEGVYASLDYIRNPKDGYSEHELRLWAHGVPIILPLGSWTIEEGVDMFASNALGNNHRFEQMIELTKKLLQRYLPLVMYICSDGVEYSGDQRPSYPTPVKTRRDGFKLFPAQKDRIWMLGEKSGRAIREHSPRESTGEGRKGPAPHIRRAHWHTLRNGKVKFFPPIPVAHNI